MKRRMSLLGILLLICMVAGVLPAAAAPVAQTASPTAAPAAPAAAAAKPAAMKDRGMRLEIGNIKITKAVLGDKTGVAGGVLTVNKAELIKYLLQDKRLGKVDVDVANPGDKTRIVRITQYIEPRARTGDRLGQFPFPGVLGPDPWAGDGTEIALKGAVVIVSNPSFLDTAPKLAPTMNADSAKIAQMSGVPDNGELGSTANVVVMTWPAKEYPESATNVPFGQPGYIDTQERNDYVAAAQIAGMRAAAYLAASATSVKPDSTDVYELPPPGKACTGAAANLPKMALIFSTANCNSPVAPGFGAMYQPPVMYGDDMAWVPALVVHPNELLDGALTYAYPSDQTIYAFQNLTYVKELYARHGKDICFVGVVTTQHLCDPNMDKRANAIAARMVSTVLGADGVIISKSGGGAPQNQVAELAKLCQQMGTQGVADPKATTQVIFTNPEPQIGVINIGESVVSRFEAVDKVSGLTPTR